MDKFSNYYGVDLSKDVFDVMDQNGVHTKFSNKACRELYQRLIAKGKSKKLALIAVANKLVKQAFAIARSGLVFDENYRSVNPIYLKK